MSVQIDTNEHRRDVTLVKGAHTWRFRCAPGDEPALLDEAARLATGADGFDWFDAAVLAHALGQCISKELRILDADRSGAAQHQTPSPRTDAATGIGRHS